MQIALFGGSFDPPHIGHHQVVTEILARKHVDQVWYVPTKQHPFGKRMAADHHRLKMLELMVQEIEKELSPQSVKIEKYELEHEAISYTFNTLEHFRKKFPEHTFSFIIGSDNIPLFHKWYKAEELLKTYEVWVYPRASFPLITPLPGMTYLQGMPRVEVSSSEIRGVVANGHSLEGLVSKGVAEYILLQGLYR